MVLEERILSCAVADRALERRGRDDVVRHRLIELVLHVARIDLREQVALLDDASDFDGLLDHGTAGLRLDVDGIDGLDDSGRLNADGDVAARDGRRRQLDDGAPTWPDTRRYPSRRERAKYGEKTWRQRVGGRRSHPTGACILYRTKLRAGLALVRGKQNGAPRRGAPPRAYTLKYAQNAIRRCKALRLWRLGPPTLPAQLERFLRMLAHRNDDTALAALQPGFFPPPGRADMRLRRPVSHPRSIQRHRPQSTRLSLLGATLVLTGFAVAGTLAIAPFDERIAHWAQSPTVQGGTTRRSTVDWLTHINETPLTLGAIATYGVGRARSDEDRRRHRTPRLPVARPDRRDQRGHPRPDRTVAPARHRERRIRLPFLGRIHPVRRAVVSRPCTRRRRSPPPLHCSAKSANGIREPRGTPVRYSSAPRSFPASRASI